MTRAGFLAIDRISHRASIAGLVGDGQVALAGVQVVISDGPAAWKSRVAALQQGRRAARPDLAISNGDGFFSWLDLPAGAYTLEAAAPDPRYAAATATATVTADAPPATVSLVLVPTRLVGSVSADKPPGPLAMARVRLVDSNEVTFTAADGTFALSPIEPGSDRALEVSAQRYATAMVHVTLQTGQTTNTTITLKHS